MAEVVRGIIELQQRLRNMSAIVKFEAARALLEEMKIELLEAQRRTPVLTGALRDSGKVDLPQVSDQTISCQITFGTTEPSSKYAIYVHEDLEAIHPTGQAKFLESVILESAPYMAQRVGRRIDLSKMGR